MTEAGDWVVVRRPVEKDVWSPSVAEDGEPSRPLKVIFKAPAKYWTDAVPIGNGRLGAMIWGGVASELIQLNEDTLWTGVPKDYTNPNGPETLAAVRKLVFDGKYAEATKEAYKLSDKPPDTYQPLGDLKLQFDDSHLKYDEGTYHRELDLDTATARVKYSVGDVEYTREHFASHPSQVIATKISGNKSGSVTFTLSLDSLVDHRTYTKGNNQIIMEGSCPGKRRSLTSDQANSSDDPKGIQFAAVVDLQISEDSGVIHVLDNGMLKVEHSDWAVLRIVAASSFDGPFTNPADSPKEPITDSLSQLKSISNLTYVDLYLHHLDDYQNLFHRVSIRLSKSSKSSVESAPPDGKTLVPLTSDFSFEGNGDDTVSTADRVKSFQTDEDPSLVELMFQFGRYLLISSSRPGTQVANLQGIWSKGLEPPWDCAQHLNINLQMNYWLSHPCNLSECQEPLFDYLSTLAVTGSKTAKVNYEVNGWLAHQVTDLWGKTSPDEGDPVWAVWPMGGAWLSTHLWEHYLYTLDKDFLKNKAYPLLEGCVKFLLEWLIDGKGQYLETNPSTSPEHVFIAPDGQRASVSYSTTMDMSIIREIFSSIVSSAEILGRSDDELIQKVRKTQPMLRPIKIARDGSVMEWAEDFQDSEPQHRHISHLFGIYPGHTVTVRKNPDICKAADNTLYKRGEDGPGWSTVWKASVWARLHNSEHAYRMIKHLFVLVDPAHEATFEGGLYSNLFGAHPPFQIDANFGFASAIAEMIVQSTTTDLYLLPALPRDKWANGCVRGLKARGRVTVNICWKEGELHEVGIWSKNQNSITRLHYRGTTVNATLSAGRVYTFNRKLRCIKTYNLS
ncbi:hypothetical protein K2173_023907 [Erythroxylum novogranatense]|uniref:Glycosyl hydrolase family 95 N-terminal domain-containing protein n=1 Tax=Erythroxylum novogranatense TaxID=1862640 RepID=A0AAV8TPR6_9ROSI|nr:hypothetical protein K2173_023907 [Erythroxylum novogranatense]